MASNFWSKDKGLKDLVTSFSLNAGETAAVVGYLKSSGSYEKGKPVTVAQVAKINEYGSSDGRIPERSFFRSTWHEQNKNLKKKIKNAARRVAEGKTDKKTALGLVAEWMVLMFKNKIQDGVPPENAPSTIAKKKSTHTLIDTGHMRDSLAWEIKEGGEE